VGVRVKAAYPKFPELDSSTTFYISGKSGFMIVLVAALPLKRKVTPEQFAGELERHLLGTGGRWDWDDTTSVSFADQRLERIRRELRKFDSLTNEQGMDELKALIAALRRGEFPEVVPPMHLSYPNR
jgi:hypothetical protein